MKRLDNKQWGSLYDSGQAQAMVAQIDNNKLSAQTMEMIKVVSECGYKSVCEIGCGSGQTVLCLARMGVHVVALDYQMESLELIKKAATIMGDKVVGNIETILADARSNLPFEENQFDLIYHAGLLEHFSEIERIEMLSQWKNYCQHMISMVPNGASVAYRYGKNKMINENRWPYGQENIIYTQILEFSKAGLDVDAEYTIGLPNSLNFLDDRNYLKKAMKKLWGEGIMEDDCHQGYLLLTSGKRRG